ncbi:MAG TPA: FKBP-type peptidyl-prolyl cis-trans isomerase [Puia sp.]
MKRISLFLLISVFSLGSFAQTRKKPASHPVKKAAGPASPAPLKTLTDSLSYSIGMMVANFSKQQGITNINTVQVANAINAEMKGGKPVMDQQQCQQVMMDYVSKQKADKAAGAKKEGSAFLEENKTKPGVISTASGLQYTVLKEGTGPKPLATDKVKCNYEGKLLDGTVFDSSDKQGHPIEFAVSGVIRGWTEALQLMPVGSKWRLFVPSDLAYGDQQMGPDIKPGSTLIFDVELLEIVK